MGRTRVGTFGWLLWKTWPCWFLGMARYVGTTCTYIGTIDLVRTRSPVLAAACCGLLQATQPMSPFIGGWALGVVVHLTTTTMRAADNVSKHRGHPYQHHHLRIRMVASLVLIASRFSCTDIHTNPHVASRVAFLRHSVYCYAPPPLLLPLRTPSCR